MTVGQQALNGRALYARPAITWAARLPRMGSHTRDRGSTLDGLKENGADKLLLTMAIVGRENQSPSDLRS